MRVALFMLAFVLLSGKLAAQQSVAEFYHKFKKQEDVTNFKLPGWLVWFGTGLIYNSTRNEETRAWLRLTRKMGKIHLLTSKKSQRMTAEDLSSFVSSLKTRQLYEEIIHVRDDHFSLNVMMREDAKGKLKELLVIGNDDNETFLVNAKTRLRMKDITEVLNYYLKELDWKKKRKRLPQA